MTAGNEQLRRRSFLALAGTVGLSATTPAVSRGVRAASGGYGTGGYGEGGYGDTTDGGTISVATGSPSGVGETTAVLAGSLDELGEYTEASVLFELRESDASSWTRTAARTRSSTGPFSETVEGLSPATDYEYRAVGETADGGGDAGQPETFSTDSGSAPTPPTIESFEATEAGSPNPHAEITATWSVSDADGDLDSVRVRILDRGGAVVDESRADASGTHESGRESFRVKHSSGVSFDVRLAVVDAVGNDASETRTVDS